MAGRTYVPELGDVVWLEFDPQMGHEQAGHRPALVMSPAGYNRKAGLMLCCPISRQVKGYPFEVLAELDGRVGVVLSDQIESMDWKLRRARKKGAVAEPVIMAVRARIKALLAIR